MQLAAQRKLYIDRVIPYDDAAYIKSAIILYKVGIVLDKDSNSVADAEPVEKVNVSVFEELQGIHQEIDKIEDTVRQQRMKT